MKTALTSIEPLETRLAPALIFAVTSSGTLATFDSATPGEFISERPIVGLFAGEEIVAIDLRPETGELFAFTDTERLFRLDPRTGSATQITANLGFDPVGTTIGLDFDPATDRLHLVTSLDEHLFLDVDGVATASQLPTLAYASGDAHFGANPAIGSVAYTNSYARANSTALFGIDHALDTLVSIDRATGKISTIGDLGFNLSPGSFDIVGAGTGLLVATNGAVTQSFSINLQTGDATLLGSFDAGVGIKAITAAPAAKLVAINGNTATYTELDGDRVTIKTSKGTFTSGMFHLSGPQDGVGTLFAIDLDGDSQGFGGADITVTATRGSAGGDGFATIGFLNAQLIDLGKVTIDGDLGRIDVGSTFNPAPALKSLTVQSLGVSGSGGGAGDRVSHIEGSVGSLTVLGDVREAYFRVEDTSSAAAVGKIGKVTIGGSLIGGAAENEGTLFAEALGTVKVQGNLVGGTGEATGSIFAPNGMGSVQVGRSLIGNDGFFSGTIRSQSGSIGSVRIGGDMTGEAGAGGGSVAALGTIGKVTIGGSLIGGEGEGTAGVTANAALGLVKIGGDVRGESAFSGLIASLGSVAGVSIGGSLIAGSDDYAGAIFSGAKLGAVTIGGDIRGNATTLATILATGTPLAPGNSDLAIASITVKGSVDQALITAGNDLNSLAVINADAQIGAIKVGGNWSRSTVAAGVDAGIDQVIGTSDDVAAVDASDSATIVSRIASITIGGQVLGTFGADSATDGYGFVAQQIGSFKAGGVKLALAKGAANDDLAATDSQFSISPTGDVRVHEVAV